MKTWCVVGIALALSGCSCFQPAAPTGCSVSFKEGAKWRIAGVSIPIDVDPNTPKVTVGSVDYTGQQAQDLSDTAQLLDIQRQANCAVMYSPGFATMSEAFRASLYQKVLALNDAITSLGAGLKQARTADEGTKAADEGKRKAEAIRQEAPKSSIGAAGGQVPEPRANDVEKQRKPNLEQSLLTLLIDKVDRLSAMPSPTRIVLLGFEDTGISLSPEMKTRLTVDFQQALDTVPLAREPSVLIVGYVDDKIRGERSAELGLRRAQAVADFLKRQKFKRTYTVTATSGGLGSPSQQGRRVEILVSEMSSRGSTAPQAAGTVCS